jgi:hypothetical protein
MGDEHLQSGDGPPEEQETSAHIGSGRSGHVELSMDRWACGFRIAKLSALATLVVEREDSLGLPLSR